MRASPALNPNRSWLLVVALLWLLPALACGGSADRSADIAPVPTFTPTPLPPPPTETPIPAADTPATPTPTRPAATINGDANLRGGPGTEYPVVGAAQAGQAVEVVAKNPAGDWYELAGGVWVAGFLVDNAPEVDVAATIPPTPAAAAPTATSQPAFIVQPTPLPQQAAVCNCSGDVYNCSSFPTHASAQACFRYCLNVGAGDIHGLDRDNDGIVCESRP